MAFIDGAVVGVALPVIGTDLEASLATMQWVVNAYVLVSAALTLIGGAVGDRFGRKRVFIAGILIFTLASLACGLARGAIPLIAARAAQGIGGAFMAGARAALQSAISIAVADSFRVLMLGASALAALSAISAAATIPSEAPS
jgi:MFS family permease